MPLSGGIIPYFESIYGSQNLICCKCSLILQQPLPVWFFLFMTSPGTACAASSSGTSHQREQLSPRSKFLGAGMETSQVLFVSASSGGLWTLSCSWYPEQDPFPLPWHGLGQVMDQGASQLPLSMESSALL